MLRRDPYSGFRFVVTFEHVQIGGFTKVRGLQSETKVESIREGGVNDFEHKLVSLTTYPNLVLERGLIDELLWTWHEAVVRGYAKRLTVAVTLRDERGADAFGWTVHGAYPVKWSLGDLDAASGQVAAETIELVHHGILMRRLGVRAA